MRTSYAVVAVLLLFLSLSSRVTGAMLAPANAPTQKQASTTITTARRTMTNSIGVETGLHWAGRVLHGGHVTPSHRRKIRRRPRRLCPRRAPALGRDQRGLLDGPDRSDARTVPKLRGCDRLPDHGRETRLRGRLHERRLEMGERPELASAGNRADGRASRGSGQLVRCNGIL